MVHLKNLFIKKFLVDIHNVIVGFRCVLSVLFAQDLIKYRILIHVTNIAYTVEIFQIKPLNWNFTSPTPVLLFNLKLILFSESLCITFSGFYIPIFGKII